MTGQCEPLVSLLERELDDFAARFSDQPIPVSGISTASLLDRWTAADIPAWLQAPSANLRLRYDVPLEDHGDV